MTLDKANAVPTCRICGCTEDHACEGGCWWVEDPEGLGNLCSACAAQLNVSPALAGDHHVWEIPLDQIRPAPWNPSSRMDPAKVKELAESIQIEGQQSPALIRPVEAEPPLRYELVWGHRRYAALQLLAGHTFSYKPAMAGQVTIKAFIREMTEEQAMISSGIENLQREGFSDIEEAEFFRTCGEHYGESAVKILAEKLSVSHRYIRKRIEILKLPDAALELWRAGTWHVGHMEQLLRLGDRDKVAAFLDKFASRRLPDLHVWELKDLVNRQAVPLHSGRFDKTECKTCHRNTDCQLRLFGGEKEKTKCLDQTCFQAKQQAWLDLNWAGCKQNKYGTQTAVLGDYDTKSTGPFGDHGAQPQEKCGSCPQFATILNLSGESPWNGHRVCLGATACYAAAQAAGKQRGKVKINPGAAEPEGPRVTWHGEFYQQEIPELMAALATDDPRRLQIALAMLVYSARELHIGFLQEIGREDLQVGADDWFCLPFPQILQLVNGFNALQCENLMAAVLVKIALRTGYGHAVRFRSEISFTDTDRQALAEFLDIDWTRYQVTAGYLEKKTKAEIIRFIVHDSGLWQTPEFKDAMLRQGFSTVPVPEKLAAAKKPQLVKLLLEGGVDLHGRLPKEIAARPKLEQ